MNILNDVVSGAARQFGREFGRAGANAVLKGANSYTVKGASDYSGRIKPSDSVVVRAIKEINRTKFVSTNKGNTSRLIELTDIVISNLHFNGVETLNDLTDLTELVNQYNDKFNHGSSLIDDDYKDKSIDYLKERREVFVNRIDSFNVEVGEFVTKNLEIEKSKKKAKKTAILLAIPLLGLQWAYLRSPGLTVLSILLFVTVIVPLINLFALLKLVFMSEAEFDLEYNPEFVYYSQFKIENKATSA